jgi:hypothetical protein
MSSIVVRFPDGTKEFRFPEKMLEEGDAVWHDGQRFRVVVSVSTDGADQAVVVVELDSGIADTLRSEEGAIRLVPIDVG